MGADIPKNMKEKMEKDCPVCNSENISIFFEMEEVPIYCNLQWKIREEAIHTPRGNIRLGFCESCGHIYNFLFESQRLKYDRNYENSLHCSPYFQDYAEELAQRLIDRYDLHGRQILEIGCGKGDFLTLLCELGNNTGIGFDPSYVPNRAQKTRSGKIIFIQDYFSGRYSNYKADFICCRQVLEHIQYPREFLTELRHTIDNTPDTIVFFEVPNGMFTLRDLGVWDLIYEHCSYFCTPSLKYLFTICGFQVRDLTETFEGQFLTVEAFPKGDIIDFQVEIRKDVESIGNHVAAFRDRYSSMVMTWKHKLEEFRNRGKRVAVWGAGSKGVTFLNVLHAKDQIDYIVDINPHKQGKYIPGGGQRIVPPDFLKKYRPDIVIIMNPIYCDEIQQVVEGLNLTPELLTV
jgi:SAM-dependent methyltransferase